MMKFINLTAAEVVTDKTHPEIVIPFEVLLFCTSVIGSFGNILIIIVVAVNQKLRTIGNMFIINLAITDLVMCSVVKPVAIYGLLRGGEMYNNRPSLCIIVGAITVTLCVGSILNIGAIAVNRYVYICHSASYYRIYTPGRTAGLCCLVWVLGFLPNFYYLFGGGAFRFDPKLLFCLYDRDSSYWFNVFLYTACLCQNVLIAVAYWKIFRFASLRSRRAARSAAGSTSLLTTVFIIFIVYTICWSPFLFIGLIDKEDKAPRVAYLVTVMLALVNSSTDWIIYTFNNRNFREAYRHLFTCNRHQLTRQNTIRAGITEF